jgi:hypothetical protein
MAMRSPASVFYVIGKGMHNRRDNGASTTITVVEGLYRFWSLESPNFAKYCIIANIQGGSISTESVAHFRSEVKFSKL